MQCKRYQGRAIGAAIGLLLCCVAYGGSCARAQVPADPNAMRVQILSGKTGRPITSQKIVLMSVDGVAGHGARRIGAEMTDGEGYAPLPDVSATSPSVQVFVEAHVPCSKSGRHTFELAKVRVGGVVSENACRPKITLYPQAGTLVFFVRDQTWLERMRH